MKIRLFAGVLAIGLFSLLHSGCSVMRPSATTAEAVSTDKAITTTEAEVTETTPSGDRDEDAAFAADFALSAEEAAEAEQQIVKDGVLRGKVTNLSQRAQTFSLSTKPGDPRATFMLAFDFETNGLKYAQKGISVVVDYKKQPTGGYYAIEIRPKTVGIPAGVETIDPETLAAMREKGANLFLFDARPKKRYQQAHLPGAHHLPPGQVSLKKLIALGTSWKSPLVFYCGGPTCGLSPAAASKTQALGYQNIWVMPSGEPGWAAAGYATYATDAFVKEGNIVLLDLRDPDLVSSAHIPRAVSLPFDKLLEAIEMEDIPRQAPVVLYGEILQEEVAALNLLRASGFKKVSLVKGGMQGWLKRGGVAMRMPLVTEISWQRKMGSGEVSLADFQQARTTVKEAVLLVDVRNDYELKMGKIPAALHIPLGELSTRLAEIPKKKPIYLHCNTGTRAEMAYHELKRLGYSQVKFLVATMECEEGMCEFLEE